MPHRIFENAVQSVKQAPTIVMFIKNAQDGWCQQFSEEGYNVFLVNYPPSDRDDLVASLDAAGRYINKTGQLWAIVTYGLLEGDSSNLAHLTRLVEVTSGARLQACIHYTPLTENATELMLRSHGEDIVPTIVHLATSQEQTHAALQTIMTNDLHEPRTTDALPSLAVYTYPFVSASPPFPFQAKPPVLVVADEKSTVDPYVRSAVSLAYSRTLDILRQRLGPRFNLEKLWEMHTYYEFVERDAPKTMSTMVKVPYVNHVPTLTGGVGYEDLARFYKYHFTSSTVTPPDTELITISRTVGSDRIIDEMIFKCTHTTEVDYFLPGIKPTGKPLQIALVGVVAFRGDKLTFEHIYWDQASVLVQLGLLDPRNVPAIAGVEVAKKVLDPFGYPSNELMVRWKDSKGLSIE